MPSQCSRAHHWFTEYDTPQCLSMLITHTKLLTKKFQMVILEISHPGEIGCDVANSAYFTADSWYQWLHNDPGHFTDDSLYMRFHKTYHPIKIIGKRTRCCCCCWRARLWCRLKFGLYHSRYTIPLSLQCPRTLHCLSMDGTLLIISPGTLCR